MNINSTIEIPLSEIPKIHKSVCDYQELLKTNTSDFVTDSYIGSSENIKTILVECYKNNVNCILPQHDLRLILSAMIQALPEQHEIKLTTEADHQQDKEAA